NALAALHEYEKRTVASYESAVEVLNERFRKERANFNAKGTNSVFLKLDRHSQCLAGLRSFDLGRATLISEDKTHTPTETLMEWTHHENSDRIINGLNYRWAKKQ
ncbi:hypothetical protein KIN20_009044, partial [Parelaphostrongylus tenuis]